MLTFATYTFMWALYDLLTFPDTSSLHGITRSVKTGCPDAVSRTGLRRLEAQEGATSTYLNGQHSEMTPKSMQCT